MNFETGELDYHLNNLISAVRAQSKYKRMLEIEPDSRLMQAKLNKVNSDIEKHKYKIQKMFYALSQHNTSTQS